MITLYSDTEHLTREEQIQHFNKYFDRHFEKYNLQYSIDLDCINEVLDIPNVFVMKLPSVVLFNADKSFIDEFPCKAYRFRSKEQLIEKIHEAIDYAEKVYVYAMYVQTEEVSMYWLRMAYKRLEE